MGTQLNQKGSCYIYRMKAGERFLNEALMDDEIILVAERRKWQKVGRLMGLCVMVFVCCRLMRIGSSMFWVAEDMLWWRRSKHVCCDAMIDEFLLCWNTLHLLLRPTKILLYYDNTCDLTYNLIERNLENLDTKKFPNYLVTNTTLHTFPVCLICLRNHRCL